MNFTHEVILLFFKPLFVIILQLLILLSVLHDLHCFPLNFLDLFFEFLLLLVHFLDFLIAFFDLFIKLRQVFDATVDGGFVLDEQLLIVGNLFADSFEFCLHLAVLFTTDLIDFILLSVQLDFEFICLLSELAMLRLFLDYLILVWLDLCDF